MRRTLLLLALLVAGFGGAGYDGPIGAVEAAHEITAETGVSSAAIVRAARPLALTVPEPGSGPAPRAGARRGVMHAQAAVSPVEVAARATTFQARRTEHLQYSALLAAARAGLLASPTTAPPPFPLV